MESGIDWGMSTTDDSSTELHELFDRYTVLRDTIQGLEAERDELGALIKAALQEGRPRPTSTGPC